MQELEIIMSARGEMYSYMLGKGRWHHCAQLSGQIDSQADSLSANLLLSDGEESCRDACWLSRLGMTSRVPEAANFSAPN